MSAVREVLAGVVEHVVSPQRPHVAELGGAAHGGDLGLEGSGQLHRVAPDSTGRADDKHSLSPPDPADIGQCLQRRAGRDRDDGRLGERQIRRLVGQLVLPDGSVLGEGAPRDPEHLVAWSEPRHCRSDADDDARHIEPRHAVLRCAKTEPEDPEQIRLPRHQMPGSSIEASCPDLDEHLILGDLRPVDPCGPKDLDGAVGVLNDRAHGRTDGCGDAAHVDPCRSVDEGGFHRILLREGVTDMVTQTERLVCSWWSCSQPRSIVGGRGTLPRPERARLPSGRACGFGSPVRPVG